MAEAMVWLPLTGDLNNLGLQKVTVTQNGTTIDDAGKIGVCYSFDGSEDYLSVSSIDGTVPEITFCCWFSPREGFESAHLMDVRSTAGVGYQPMYITASSIQVGGSSTAYPTIGYTFTAGNWYHIAVVYSETDCKTYINGELIGTSTVAMSDDYGQNLPMIIASRCNNSTHLKCKVNDVRVYYSALTTKEVRDVARTLVLHFPLDNNGYGTDKSMMTTVYDCSGYHHDGTLTSAPTGGADTARHVASTHFDGEDDGILIRNLNLNPIINDSHTISFWINSESGTTSTGEEDYSEISPYTESGIGTGLKLYWNGEVGGWHHIALVCEGLTKTSVYYDGELRQSTTSARTVTTFSNNWRIGRGPMLDDEHPYHGMISDFRIYATALPVADIKYLYEVGASVDDGQNFHTYEYVEATNTLAKIHKTGVTKSIEFTEAENARIYDDGKIDAFDLIEI